MDGTDQKSRGTRFLRLAAADDHEVESQLIELANIRCGVAAADKELLLHSRLHVLIEY